MYQCLRAFVAVLRQCLCVGVETQTLRTSESLWYHDRVQAHTVPQPLFQTPDIQMVLATVLPPAFHATGDGTRPTAGRDENDLCTDNVQKDVQAMGTANLI